MFGATLLERVDSFEEKRQLAEFDRKGDWTGMLGFAQALQKRDPKRPDWAVVAGYAEMKIGDYRKATEVLSKVTQVSPEDIGAWNMLGECQRLAGRPDESSRTLERASAIGRTSFQTFFLLGQAYRDAGRTARAAEAYTESTRIEPTFARAWFELGSIRVRTGDMDQARAALEQLQALDPDLAKQLADKIGPSTGK